MKQIIKNILIHFKKEYYLYIPKGLLFLNSIVNSVFRVNKNIPISIHFTSRVSGFNHIEFPAGDISIIKSFAVSGGCYFEIFDQTTLKIGAGTIWANNVCIQTGNHDSLDRSKHIIKDVTIGKNCWLGTGVTILPGVMLGDNVTVGANSVVTKSFPDNCVIAGVPARIIRDLNNP
jgi:acetyltransferase-like isoleucine patch superfamily enzyme